jgi:hypothetical protein
VTTTPLIPAVLLGLTLLLAPALPLRAEHAGPNPRCCLPLTADVWLIETRCLPHPCAQRGIYQKLRFERLENERFIAASKDEFLATLDPSQTTCFFVHGNRLSASDARRIGVDFARRLGPTNVPYRFVIWSWPSDRVVGLIRDARVKAVRADGESYYLASVLAELPPSADVSLVGWSFGARAITGGLHLLGGGVFVGNSLNRVDQPSVRPRVVLMGAAVPRGWLLPGGAHGLAPLQVEQLTLFFNPRDPALKHFPVVFGPGWPQAVGYEGISTRQLGAVGDLVQQYNVSGTIGHSHSMARYTRSAWIMSTVRQFALEVEQP